MPRADLLPIILEARVGFLAAPGIRKRKGTVNQGTMSATDQQGRQTILHSPVIGMPMNKSDSNQPNFAEVSG